MAGQYAYDNMILFHVQRLSGGFVLTGIAGIVGLVGFSATRSVAAGFVFLAYMVGVSLYLYTMGKTLLLLAPQASCGSKH